MLLSHTSLGLYEFIFPYSPSSEIPSWTRLAWREEGRTGGWLQAGQVGTSGRNTSDNS